MVYKNTYTLHLLQMICNHLRFAFFAENHLLIGFSRGKEFYANQSMLFIAVIAIHINHQPEACETTLLMR